MNHPTEHPLWPRFLEFADANGVSLDHEDDWNPWWGCFLAGAKAAWDKDAEDRRNSPGRAYMDNG